jgi:site-specific DNA recombinase
LRVLHDTATARGYVIPPGAEFVEVYSGKTADDRRQLGRLRAAAQQGAFDIVLTLCPDRWGRDVIDALVVKRELQRVGVTLEYANLKTDDSPMSKAMEIMAFVLAESERGTIVERVTRARREKAERNQVPSAPVVLGYVRDKTAPCGLKIDPVGADWVRKIFRWVIDGASLSAVRRRLTAQNCPSPRGGPWAHTTVQELIRREIYVGRYWYNRRTGGQGSRTFRPADEHIRITVPPIIRQAEFDRAQAQVRRHRSILAGRPAQHVYLAGGLVMCGPCGRSLRGDIEHGSTLVYRCAGRRSDATITDLPRCRFRILASRVDAALWATVAAEVREKATGRRLAPDTMRGDVQRELADLERAATTIAGQRDRLVTLHLTDRISLAVFDAKDRPLVAEAERIAAERARVAALIASGQAAADQQAAALAHCRLLVRNLDGLDARGRKELIRRMVVNVVVHRDHLDVRGLFPLDPDDSHAPERGRVSVATLR